MNYVMGELCYQRSNDKIGVAVLSIIEVAMLIVRPFVLFMALQEFVDNGCAFDYRCNMKYDFRHKQDKWPHDKHCDLDY